MQLAVGLKLLAPARQDLVAVGLVAHVPHDAVVGRIEDVVQRHGQLYHAQARSQVARVHRQLLHDVLSQFVAQFGQLLHAQFSEVGRQLYLVQKFKLLLLFHFLRLSFGCKGTKKG